MCQSECCSAGNQVDIMEKNRGFFSLKWGLCVDSRTRQNSNGMQGAKKETLCRIYNNNNKKGTDITHFWIGEKWSLDENIPHWLFYFNSLKSPLQKKHNKKRAAAAYQSASRDVDALFIWLFLHFDNKQKLLQRWFSIMHSVPRCDCAFKLTQLNFSVV